MTALTANPYASLVAELDPSLISADVAVGAEGWAIDYEMTPEDLAAFNFVAATTSQAKRKSSRAVRVMGMLAGVVPLFWIMALLKMAPVTSFMGAALGFAVLISLFGSLLGFVRVYFSTLDRQQLELFGHPENANALGRRRIWIAPGGVHELTPTSQSMTRWQGVTRIESRPEALYLFTAGFSASIVPRRAFSENALFEQFAKVAAEFHRNAKNRAVDETRRD
jgi:YcxB-like protein